SGFRRSQRWTSSCAASCRGVCTRWRPQLVRVGTSSGAGSGLSTGCDRRLDESHQSSLPRYTGIVYIWRVIRSFADETTRDLFGNVNSKAARRIPNVAWRAAQRKLKQLDLVATLGDLKIPP